MQRIGQLFFQHARAFRHLHRIGQPVGTMGDIGPGARGGDPARQGVDIALDRIEAGDLLGEPVARDMAAKARAIAGDEAPDARHGAGMMLRAQLLEIGQATGGPEPLDIALGADTGLDLGIFGHAAQHGEVDRLRRGAQSRAIGPRLQIDDEMIDAVGAWHAVAPEKLVDGREAMRLDRLYLFGREGGVAILRSQAAEGAILVMAPGAAGDLGHFGDRQPARAAAVKLAQRGEGDMGDVEVEAHADRVGGDQIIDVAIEEHLHLGIAGARRQGAHHHRRAAPEAAQHFRHGIDFLGREGDDRRAARQARQLLGAGIGEGGKARPADDLDLRDQALDRLRDAGGAQDHRFLPAAGAQDAVGEDMAPLGIGAQLRLVQRDKGEIAEAAGHRGGFLATTNGHGFGGAEKIARARRHDLFLAGDERDLLRALDRDDAVIDFARQQAQRKAHHAAGMAAHALDGEMGLAGIGGAQHSGDGRTGELGHDGAYVVQDGGQGKDFARSARCSLG